MLCRHVPCYQSSRYLLPALPALHPYLMSLPLVRSLSCHPLPVRSLQLDPCLLSWAAYHADCLPYIITQTHPIKHDNHGNKYNLEPSWVQQCNPGISRTGPPPARPHTRISSLRVPIIPDRGCNLTTPQWKMT